MGVASIKPFLLYALCALVITCGQDQYQHYSHRRAAVHRPHPTPTPKVIEYNGKLYDL